MSDLKRDEGSACLGRRTAVVLQNAIEQNKRPKFQNIDRVKAPAKGAGRRCPAMSPWQHSSWGAALRRVVLVQ